MELSDLLHRATPAARALCTDCRSTWWRWCHARAPMPVAVRSLLRIVVGGDLSHFGPTWRGWSFNVKRGALVDPAGYEHTPGTIRAWWWLAQELQGLRGRENQRAQILPPNVVMLPIARPAHALTAELYRRLEAQQ